MQLPIVRQLKNMGRQRHVIPILAVLALVFIATILWYYLEKPTEAHSSVRIAVMPLSTIGADESTLRLASGLTEDMIADLSRER
jgi:hypothetical protein